LLDGEGAGAFGSLVGTDEARGDLEREVIMGGVRETSPATGIEGVVGDLLHVVLEHSEDEVDHYAILELQDFGGGRGV
jgi:hypothetical protein